MNSNSHEDKWTLLTPIITLKKTNEKGSDLNSNPHEDKYPPVAGIIPLKKTNEKRFESSRDARGIKHDCLYLTLAGLFRVASVSRIPNANLLKLFNWLLNLFYIYQFGSYEERNELARSMFKQVLNDKLAAANAIVENQKLTHENEMLRMQLKLAQMNLA